MLYCVVCIVRSETGNVLAYDDDNDTAVSGRTDWLNANRQSLGYFVAPALPLSLPPQPPSSSSSSSSPSLLPSATPNIHTCTCYNFDLFSGQTECLVSNVCHAYAWNINPGTVCIAYTHGSVSVSHCTLFNVQLNVQKNDSRLISRNVRACAHMHTTKHDCDHRLSRKNTVFCPAISRFFIEKSRIFLNAG